MLSLQPDVRDRGGLESVVGGSGIDPPRTSEGDGGVVQGEGEFRVGRVGKHLESEMMMNMHNYVYTSTPSLYWVVQSASILLVLLETQTLSYMLCVVLYIVECFGDFFVVSMQLVLVGWEGDQFGGSLEFGLHSLIVDITGHLSFG